jgi:hypothetical protein
MKWDQGLLTSHLKNSAGMALGSIRHEDHSLTSLSHLARGFNRNRFDWSIGVVKRREIDPMPFGDCLNLLYSLRSDEPFSLRERFEPALQSESHAFK